MNNQFQVHFTRLCTMFYLQSAIIPFHIILVFSFVVESQYHYIYALRSLLQWTRFLIYFKLFLRSKTLNERMKEKERR